MHRYAGTVPFMHLYTMTISLYVIRYSTGNQCSCFNTGVMCSRNGVRVTKRAALCWMGICEIGRQGVAVVQSRCYESLYYAPCCICCDITADRRRKRWMLQALHTAVTCLSMVKCWSICTPRFLTTSQI